MINKFIYIQSCKLPCFLFFYLKKNWQFNENHFTFIDFQIKQLKSELSKEKKNVSEKENKILSLENLNEQLKLASDEREKDLELKMHQCDLDKEASSTALKKVKHKLLIIIFLMWPTFVLWYYFMLLK